MKKNYMKPEVNEIAVEANQAIATCGNYQVGYENSSTRGCGQSSGRLGYQSIDAAWAAYDHADWYNMTTQEGGVLGKAEFNQDTTYGPWVYKIGYAETYVDGVKTCGTYNDLNSNGVMDGGEYQCWQEGDYNAWAAVASGAAAAVMNS